MPLLSSRIARLASCTLVALVVMAVPAAAKPSGPSVAGRVTGKADFALSTKRCAFVEQKFDLTVASKSTSAHLTIDVCVDVSTDVSMDGTFKLTAGKDSLRGTAAGSFASITKNPAPITLTLTVTKSGGAFHRVHGTLTLKGKWKSDTVSTGPVTGALSSSLQ